MVATVPYWESNEFTVEVTEMLPVLTGDDDDPYRGGMLGVLTEVELDARIDVGVVNNWVEPPVTIDVEEPY